jgi:hypothetical protein
VAHEPGDLSLLSVKAGCHERYTSGYREQSEREKGDVEHKPPLLLTAANILLKKVRSKALFGACHSGETKVKPKPPDLVSELGGVVDSTIQRDPEFHVR